MTQWVENPEGGRDRGPVALLRAWGEVLVRPRRLFRSAVAPADQAPGLAFAATVVTVILIPFTEERAGVSETVQTLAYAGAPCVFAALPSPAVRLVAAAYGALLLVVGTSEVHGLSLPAAAALSAVPSALVFGYAFRGFASFSAVTGLTWADLAALV
ncbi:hypothetical protein BRC67_05505 [Halobacteriales archaeon QH_3_68_24]|nr:MAG: hypothetical protein BRC67_05505 [Halobacteriales archaeon QH_3_68_24]